MNSNLYKYNTSQLNHETKTTYMWVQMMHKENITENAIDFNKI